MNYALISFSDKLYKHSRLYKLTEGVGVRYTIFIIIFLTILISACTSTNNANTVNNLKDVEVIAMNTTLKISSPAFMHNNLMPRKYTCQGQNVNPPLIIEGVPQGTKSMVLIIDDPDAPMGTWDHWILFNIPLIAKIEENSTPPGAIGGINGFGDTYYNGPCPPSGTHRYFFKLYALNTTLYLDEGARKSEVENAMRGHILGQAQMIGLYKKS